MSYLHCHNCNWGQDDFWDLKRYNPIKVLIEDFRENIKPRRIEFDYTFAEENFGTRKPINSWRFLIFEIKRNIRKTINMKYWTYNSFMKAKEKGKAKCPKCGSGKHFDID